MLEVSIADSFFEAQRKLDPAQTHAVQTAIHKLRRGGPQQVGLHALKGLPFESFEVTRNAMRVVCWREGGQLVLLWVAPHDEAYAWAGRHRVVRIGDVMRLRALPRDEESAKAPTTLAVEGPLAALRERELARFGLEPDVAAWLRTVPDDDVLLGLAVRLEPSLGEALVSLARDPDGLDMALRAYEAKRSEPPAPERSLREILSDPRNRAHFFVPPPGEEALAKALEADFERWRIFLHPSQRRTVEMDARGPVKLTGGPGTGKTVVALHRARHLAERVFASDPRPVLVTAFSRPLVAEMKRSFAGLCADAPALVDRVTFRTATGVAQDILRDRGAPGAFLNEEDLAPAWAEAMRQEALELPRSFYASERLEVLAQHGAWSEAAYFRAPRAGRGTRLDRLKRAQVWAVLAAFEAGLDGLGGADDVGLALRARRLVEADPELRPFAAVVCDELQDLWPESLRLLAALAVDAEGEPRPNGLFLVGDGFQRIFRRPVALAACGVDVVGRSRHLRLNYRTTEGLRAAAVAVVSGRRDDPLDDAPGGEPGHQSYRSIRPGPAPERPAVTDDEDEHAQLAERLRASKGLILVLARTRARLERASADLLRRGVAHVRLEEDTLEAPADARCVLSTMHRAKGLEAPEVIVLSEAKPPRRPPEVDAVDWQRRQDALTYVAITRARDRCILFERRSASSLGALRVES